GRSPPGRAGSGRKGRPQRREGPRAGATQIAWAPPSLTRDLGVDLLRRQPVELVGRRGVDERLGLAVLNSQTPVGGDREVGPGLPLAGADEEHVALDSPIEGVVSQVELLRPGLKELEALWGLAVEDLDRGEADPLG